MSVTINTTVERKINGVWKSVDIALDNVRSYALAEIVEECSLTVEKDDKNTTATNKKFGVTYDSLSDKVKEDAFVNCDRVSVLLKNDFDFAIIKIDDRIEEEKEEFGDIDSDNIRDLEMFRKVIEGAKKLTGELRLVIWFD